MDVLTQGLLGSALSQSIANKKETRLATGIGFFSGLIADADVLIGSSSDPLLTIEFHRHFTHSILFIPVGALIAALLLWPFIKSKLEFRRLYLFCFMGYSLSGFIDTCTSYGTHLLWPFNDERLAFHIISIVDPIFTGMLFIAVVWAWLKYRSRLAHVGLVLCGIYLLLGTLQLYRATDLAEELAESRNHDVDHLIVKPTFGNILLWRSTYISNGRIYVDAVRPGIFDNNVYKGESIALFVAERDAPDIAIDSVLYKDIIRFKTFSENYIAMDPRYDNILGDMRYGMLPTSTKSMWGITLDNNQPDKHARYNFFRENTPSIRSKFWSMLTGKSDETP